MNVNQDISQAISQLLDRLKEAEDKLARTPTAFRWTPAMSAIWPKEMRPTMTGLLAIWEAMHEAAEYSSSKAASDDGWIEHRAGDPNPARDYKGQQIEAKWTDGAIVKEWYAEYWADHSWRAGGPEITHWRPAK